MALRNLASERTAFDLACILSLEGQSSDPGSRPSAMGISSLQGHLGAMQYYEKNPGWKDGIRGPGQVPPRLWASFPDGERSGWEFQFLGPHGDFQ